MRISRIRIRNFRCINEAEIFPTIHNVFLGPNNVGKTAILEALNLLLNPEITYRSRAIDENDFYKRIYQNSSTESLNSNEENSSSDEISLITDQSNNGSSIQHQKNPTIYIEVVIDKLSLDDEDYFRDNLVPWIEETREIVESTDEGQDPFETAQTAIRVFFEGWYDPDEDDFFYGTYFLPEQSIDRDECPKLNREQKRFIGFLIYRDFRALTRAITLESATLFGRLIQSQNITIKHFEDVLDKTEDALLSLTRDPDFLSILNSYKSEIERFLPLSEIDPSVLSFYLTDRTRNQFKSNAQLYVKDQEPLPMQKMGAGTRSLAILSMLTLIMRRRDRGILALEEPETFLFPHAQRRVIDECLELADQTFVTTHSPYILERIPVEGVGRIERKLDGKVNWTRISTESIKQINLYSKRLKQVHCEALVGQGVVIVEGDSDRWWLSGASRILNRKKWNNRIQEALELQGVSIISADTNGDIIKLGEFFLEVGLKVLCLFDNITDTTFITKIIDSQCPSILLKQKGLEDLLSDQLPIDILKKFLTEAPYCKNDHKTISEVNSMLENSIRSESRNWLKNNKGSASMHEWLISLLNFDTLPYTLGDIIDMVTSYVKGSYDIKTGSLIR